MRNLRRSEENTEKWCGDKRVRKTWIDENDEWKTESARVNVERIRGMKEITEEYAGAVAFVLAGGMILRIFGEVLRMVSL